MSSTPSTWPTMLPNCLRFVCNMPKHQDGFVIKFSMLLIVGLGGALSPLRRSLCRCAKIWRSRVTISAEQFATFARAISLRIKSLSRITYNWNQNGFDVLDATSSIEHIDIVESVKGTPNSSAAFAANISPSARCIPVRPVGARATGIGRSWPSISILVLRSLTLAPTLCRSFRFSKSFSLDRYVDSVQEPESA